MRIIILLLSIAIQNGMAFADTTTISKSKPLENFEDVFNMSKALPLEITPAEVRNIPQFCQINGLRDRGEFFADDSRSMIGFYREKQDYIVNNVRHIYDGGWDNSFIATRDARDLNFLKYFKELEGPKDTIKPLSKDERAGRYAAVLEKIKGTQASLSETQKTFMLAALSEIDGWSVPQSDDYNAGKLQAAYICKDITLTNIASCTSGLQLIVNTLAAPKGPAAIYSFIPIWQNIANDPIYLKAFKTTALKIVEALANNNARNSTLFDDLEKSFGEFVSNPQKIDDYTWNTMALLGSGGGNMRVRAAGLTNTLAAREFNAPSNILENVEDFFWILTVGAMALDRLSADQGFLYSYPKQVNSLCDYGKNYHFWLSAYLAREAAKATGNIEGGAAASYSAEKAYQFAKKGSGRDPSKPFSLPIYSNYTNNIRLDLAQAAAGAWFGANSIKSATTTLTEKQFDTVLLSEFASSSALPKPIDVTQDTFSLTDPIFARNLYLGWRQIVNPDLPYKSFAKILGY